MRKMLLYDHFNAAISNNSKGLFVVSAPTGYGKTYQVLKYIQQNFKHKKIFYIVNQEKLIQPLIDELTNGLNTKEADELINNTLHLKSIVNTYKDQLPKLEIKQNKLDKETNDLLKTIRNIVESFTIKSIDSEVSEILFERFYENEKKLRYIIKNKLIYDKVHIEWINKLYPSIDIDKFNVIFMTTKKFFLPIDPLTKKTYFLYEKNFTDSVLFIDEFDSVKQELLNIIIEEKSNEKVELFRLFRNINNALNDISIINDFPQSESGGIQYAYEYLDNIKKYFDNKNDYLSNISLEDGGVSTLNYAFKSKDFITQKNFVFNDGYNITIVGGNQRKYLEYNFDSLKNRNEITLVNKKGSKNLEFLIDMILDSISYFISQTANLVFEYKKNYDKQKDESIEPYAIYSSIIDRMNLGEENKSFLVASIHDYLINSKSIVEDQASLKKSTTRKVDFYTRGFSYVEIVDSLDHHLESKLYTYNYSKTPERIMITAATNFHVIGLSATATIDSAIVNFDLNYISQVLRENYKEFNNTEINEIQEDYNLIKESYYKQTVFEIGYIDEKSVANDKRYLESVLNNEFAYNKHVSVTLVNKNIEDHHLKQCADLYQVVDKFMSVEEMHSFIYFTNSNMNNWNELKDLVIETVKNKYKNLKIIILDANYYKNNDISNIIKSSKKVFVISAYNTVGIGVNLQYEIEDDFEAKFKDFDGIFLTDPTNIIQNLSGDIVTRSELAKFIFAIEYSKVRDSITIEKHKKAIRYAFDKYQMRISSQPFKYIENDEIALGMVKVIIQAIGRISRTNQQRKYIQIFTTKKTCELLARTNEKIKHLPKTYEFDKLIEFIGGKYKFKKPIEIINNPIAVQSYSDKFIKGFIYPWKWTKDKIEKWMRLREYVLKNPTLESGQICEFGNIYFEFSRPVHEYSSDNQYKVKEISNNSNHFRIAVSKFESNLYAAMKVDYLKEEFINKGYAVEFVANRKILSINIYKRIYKAAIGEVVGELILKKNNIRLQPIVNPTLFELFDYFKENVYFDFKNWSYDFEVDKYEQIKKINLKIGRVKATHVFIINTFYQGYNNINEYIRDSVYIITIPWLINQNGNINKRAIAKIIEKTGISK